MSTAVVTVWTPKGKVSHGVANQGSDGVTICGLQVGYDWHSEVQSEHAFVNTAKGACAKCQRALRKRNE